MTDKHIWAFIVREELESVLKTIDRDISKTSQALQSEKPANDDLQSRKKLYAKALEIVGATGDDPGSMTEFAWSQVCLVLKFRDNERLRPTKLKSDKPDVPAPYILALQLAKRAKETNAWDDDPDVIITHAAAVYRVALNKKDSEKTKDMKNALEDLTRVIKALESSVKPPGVTPEARETNAIAAMRALVFASMLRSQLAGSDREKLAEAQTALDKSKERYESERRGGKGSLKEGQRDSQLELLHVEAKALIDDVRDGKTTTP